jgi:hypothetical protein
MKTNSFQPSALWGPSRPHSYTFLLKCLMSLKSAMCTENLHHWLLTYCLTLSRESSVYKTH